MKNNELSLATIINETTNKSHGLTPLKNSLTLQLNTIQLYSPFQAKQTKEEKFKEAIMQEVTSAKTINEISEVVGQPKKNETEEEFVDRSVKNIVTYLKNKFN